MSKVTLSLIVIFLSSKREHLPEQSSMKKTMAASIKKKLNSISIYGTRKLKKGFAKHSTDQAKFTLQTMVKTPQSLHLTKLKLANFVMRIKLSLWIQKKQKLIQN